MMKLIKSITPTPLKQAARYLKIAGPQAYRRLLFGDTSQFGEVSACRRLIGADWPKMVVDVGAFDGWHLSNSYPFIREGWEAVLIEPHPANFKRMVDRFGGNSKVRCLEKACSNVAGTLPLFLEKGHEQTGGLSATLLTDQNRFMDEIRSEQTVMVSVETLTEILGGCGIARDFSILSVDAEGVDFEVLQGLDPTRYRPRLVITEEYEWEPAKHQAKYALLRERDYVCSGKVGCNTIWIAKELQMRGT